MSQQMMTANRRSFGEHTSTGAGWQIEMEGQQIDAQARELL
jgi:hypothetical protein